MILLNLISIQRNVFKRGGYIEPLLIFWHIHLCDIGGMQDTEFPNSFLGLKSCASHGSSNYSLIMFTLLVSENRARTHWSGLWKVTSLNFVRNLRFCPTLLTRVKFSISSFITNLYALDNADPSSKQNACNIWNEFALHESGFSLSVARKNVLAKESQPGTWKILSSKPVGDSRLFLCPSLMTRRKLHDSHRLSSKCSQYIMLLLARRNLLKCLCALDLAPDSLG